jgi:hypothetical protein
VAAIRFEWDEAKNRSNQRKHGISFQEASQVFLDPMHIVVADRVVGAEQRWQALGLVRRPSGCHLLVQVAHTVREESEPDTFIEVVRIISARKAVPEERKIYEDENGQIHTGDIAAVDRGPNRRLGCARGSAGQ